MTEISFAYWNALADQTILIGSLLGGFSIAVTANIIVSENTSRLLRNILVASTLSASFFSDHCVRYDQVAAHDH